MEHTPTWNVEQVWGSDRFYYEGDVASEQIAFVIDSGIAPLDDFNINTEWSRSFVDEFPDPFEDITGHGTSIASIIGAKANGVGLTGVAPGAELVALRVFGDKGWANGRDIGDALEYARDVIVTNNLFDRAVVNLSLGGGSPSRHPLVQEMADMGIKFSIAAGNSARDVDGYSPASYGHHENVYTVSSITEGGEYSNFTNFDGVDLNGEDDTDYTAPGSRIPTYTTEGTIKYKNGTSFSAPHIAGVLLMSEEIRPGQTFTLNSDQVEKGMIPDPLGMFDPYTYKHGPSTGEPAPDVPSESIPPEVFIPFAPVDERMKLRGDSLDNTLVGGDNRDKIRGLKGDDILIGNEGNDVLRAGKGDDYIDAGIGSDLITSGYGLNTIIDQRDGFTDTLIITPDGDPSKADVLEGLDEFDNLMFHDVWSYRTSVSEVEGGIGIFVDNIMEAIYTGNDLSVDQVAELMT